MSSIFLFSDRDNVGIVVKLEMKDRPNVQLVAATTHLLYNPRRNDIKLGQTQLMLAEIEKLAYKGHNRFTGEPEYLPIIFTGDMNYSPDSGKIYFSRNIFWINSFTSNFDFVILAVYKFVTKSYFEYAGLSNKFLKPDSDGSILDKVLLPAWLGVTDTCQHLSSLSQR